MANDVKWIKITTDVFNDEKILLLESLPEADTIIVIWFKLLTLAGKQHNDGVFWLTDRIAYTDEMLATIFRRKLNTVRMALAKFEELGMIEIVNNVITIPNWSRYQNFDALDRKRERDREYQREYRLRQKVLAGGDEGSYEPPESPEADFGDTPAPITSPEPGSPPAPPREPVERKPTDIDKVLEAWNSVEKIPSVKRIVKGKTREIMLLARIRENGLEDVLEAIENIKKSPHLLGVNKRGWQITFDWFVRPNNFAKVLDGNYVDLSVSVESGSTTQERQTLLKPKRFVTVVDDDGYEVDVEVKDEDEPGTGI